jgi:hypothetical protein
MCGVVCVVAAACQSASRLERWEAVMGQTGFAIDSLHFGDDGSLRAVDANGRVLVREPAWNKWAPPPSFAASSPLRAEPRRSWDAQGFVYVSNAGIYRAKATAPQWQLLEGSLGLELITIDPEGNVYARNLRAGPRYVVQLAGATQWVEFPGPVSAIDPRGRPWVGAQLLRGTELVSDPLVTSPLRFDAKGRQLQLISSGAEFRVQRHDVGDASAEELHRFETTSGRAVELVGCGLDGACILLAEDDVFQLTGSTPKHIGNLTANSSSDALNFSGFRLGVGGDGLLYLFEAQSDGAVSRSRVFRLQPGSEPFPGDAL